MICMEKKNIDTSDVGLKSKQENKIKSLQSFSSIPSLNN